MRHLMHFPRDKDKAIHWAERATEGWVCEFREKTRSLEQNSRFWEILGRVANRCTLNGQTFDAESWKCIFMKAMGQEVRFLPTLDGQSFFPSGFRSSQLTTREMADLQTFVEAWCAEQGQDIWSDE